MTIHCSCGHEVDDMDQCVTVTIADYNEWGEPAVMYGWYCQACRDQAHREGRLLYDEGEENKWLGGR